MLGFALLFVAAGVAQSALARDVEAVASSTAWVWLSAMAAFGVFYICLTLAEQLERGKGVQALAGFALFYALCGVANVWRYVRGQIGRASCRERGEMAGGVEGVRVEGRR